MLAGLGVQVVSSCLVSGPGVIRPGKERPKVQSPVQEVGGELRIGTYAPRHVIYYLQEPEGSHCRISKAPDVKTSGSETHGEQRSRVESLEKDPRSLSIYCRIKRRFKVGRSRPLKNVGFTFTCKPVFTYNILATDRKKTQSGPDLIYTHTQISCIFFF